MRSFSAIQVTLILPEGGAPPPPRPLAHPVVLSLTDATSNAAREAGDWPRINGLLEMPTATNTHRPETAAITLVTLVCLPQLRLGMRPPGKCTNGRTMQPSPLPPA